MEAIMAVGSAFDDAGVVVEQGLGELAGGGGLGSGDGFIALALAIASKMPRPHAD
jgi:hypothetical protein